mgnify:CR=1 FL=1
MLRAQPQFYFALKINAPKQLNSGHQCFDILILKIKGWGLFVVMEGQSSYQSLLVKINYSKAEPLWQIFHLPESNYVSPLATILAGYSINHEI